MFSEQMLPVLTSVLASVLSLCGGQPVNSCGVSPKDKYVELGSDTQVFCRTSCVRGKILWTLNNRRLDPSPSHQVNSSHWVLTLSNFSQHSAMLQCHSATNLQVLGGTIIRSYTRPSITSCLLHYESESRGGMPQLFTCDWEHHMNSTQPITYSVLVSSSSVPQSEMCSATLNRCTAHGIHLSNKIHLVQNFSVTVRASAASWEARSLPRHFNPYHILKILPPTVNVSVVSDELLVEWRRSLLRRTSPSPCQVKYKQTVGNETSETLLDSLLKTSERGKVLLKWESCRQYGVSVRCALDSAPWSEWSPERRLRTELKKRDVKLHLWRRISPPDGAGVRRVRVMWRGVPSTCPGNFTYSLGLAPTPQKDGGNPTGSQGTDWTRDLQVNGDSHRIHLTVFQNQDPLGRDSVYVPAADQSLPLVSDLRTSAADGLIQVKWTAPARPVRTYVIDWTRDGTRYEWKESERPEATLSDLLDKRRYDITVTPVFQDETGLGRRALGVCSRVGDPGNVTIVGVEANDRGAAVSWSVKSQEECSGAAVAFTVFYGAQGEATLNVTTDGATRRLLLKDLSPDTQHRVYVRASASTGTSVSSERLFRTKRFDPTLVWGLCVFGSLSIALLLCLGLFCTVQCKRFREKHVPNPGLSSVALWLLPDQQKGSCLPQVFRDPSASLCDRVYTEDMQLSLSHPSDTHSDLQPPVQPYDEYTDPIAVLPTKPHEQTPPRSPGESSELLSSENSPYRSQSSGETAGKPPRCVSPKAAALTVYVTMNMLKQGQGR